MDREPTACDADAKQRANVIAEERSEDEAERAEQAAEHGHDPAADLVDQRAAERREEKRQADEQRGDDADGVQFELQIVLDRVHENAEREEQTVGDEMHAERAEDDYPSPGGRAADDSVRGRAVRRVRVVSLATLLFTSAR